MFEEVVNTVAVKKIKEILQIGRGNINFDCPSSFSNLLSILSHLIR